MSERKSVLRVALGCDHAALSLKLSLKGQLEQMGAEVIDVGTHTEASCDYPDFAHAVAEGVAAGRYDRGVLICGTGLGMSYAANRHAGVRAAVCTNEYLARMARAHNDANVLCLGARVVGPGLAEAILHAFMETAFDGDRHARRVAKVELDRMSAKPTDRP
jgi:ribose 5-phosphate isomerase B